MPQLKLEIVESILSAFETCQFVTFISYSFLVCAEPTVCFLTPKILVFVDRMQVPILFTVGLPGLRINSA